MPRVEAAFLGGFKYKIVIQSPGSNTPFVFYNDYPEMYGGEGTAATPWDTFLVALMGCQMSRVRDFCSKHNVLTEELKLQMDITYKEGNQEVDEFKIHIVFPKQFPEELKEEALQAARNCKVVKHILDYTPTFTYSTEFAV